MTKHSLSKKIRNKEWIENLSERAKRKLEICIAILKPEELESYSSINTAYKIARERYIETCLGKDPELYYDIPIFIDIEKYRRIVSP